MRKMICCVLAAVFFFTSSGAPASAWPWSKANPHGKDVRFSTIYPTPFLSTRTGKVTLYLASAAAVMAVTYFTAGTGTAAAAGPITTFVGGSIGGVMGLHGIAAVNAGLAMLGGGTVASGYFGILGGIAVLNGIGDIALALAVDTALSNLPENSHHGFVQLIKLKPFFSPISRAVKKDLKEFEAAWEEADEDPEKAEFYASRLERALSAEIDRAAEDDTTAYNNLLLSILRYNNGDFDEARSAAAAARRFVDPMRSSVLDYVDALMDLAEGKEMDAIQLLERIIAQEPDALPPYIVLAQIRIDRKDFVEAFRVLQLGLKNVDGRDCSMNWMAGNCLYANGHYEEAIKYYRKALSNMTINEYEALYKLNIARCYRRMGRAEDGKYWLEDAIAEVDDRVEMVSDLRRQYEEE